MRYTETVTLASGNRHTITLPAYDKAMKNLKAKGVKFGDNTLTVPKGHQLGIKAWGFIEYLKSTKIAVVMGK